MDLRTRKSRRQARRPFPPPEPGQEFLLLRTRVARGGNINPAPFDGRVVRVSAVSFADAPAATSEVVQHRDVRFVSVELAAGLLEGKSRRGRVPSPYPDCYGMRRRMVLDLSVADLFNGRAFRTQPSLLLGEQDVEVPHHHRRTKYHSPLPGWLDGRARRTRFMVEDPPAIVGMRPRATQIATLVPIELIQGNGRVKRGKAFPDEVVDAVPQRRLAAGDQLAFAGRVTRGRNFYTGLEGFPDPCPERPIYVEESPTEPPVLELSDSQPPYTDESEATPPKFTDECR